jgi:hypothetical protein
MRFFIGGIAAFYLLMVLPASVNAQTNTDGSGFGAIPTVRISGTHLNWLLLTMILVLLLHTAPG